MVICMLTAIRLLLTFVFFFSSRRRHTRSLRDWSSDVCSSDLERRSLARRPPPGRCLPWISTPQCPGGGRRARDRRSWHTELSSCSCSGAQVVRNRALNEWVADRKSVV